MSFAVSCREWYLSPTFTIPRYNGTYLHSSFVDGVDELFRPDSKGVQDMFTVRLTNSCSDVDFHWKFG